jgi:hypothetical protein
MSGYLATDGTQASLSCRAPQRKEPSDEALHLLRRTNHFPMLQTVAQWTFGMAESSISNSSRRAMPA